MIYRYHFRVIIFFVPGNEEQNENLMHRYIHSLRTNQIISSIQGSNHDVLMQACVNHS